MSVTVRLYAAARDAAGRAEVPLPAGDLETVLAALRTGRGPAFGRLLDSCSLLLDGGRPEPGTQLRDGDVLEVLPPFAGG